MNERRFPQGLEAATALRTPRGKGTSDYLAQELDELRGVWVGALRRGRAELLSAVNRAGYVPVSGGSRSRILLGSRKLGDRQVVAQARLKRTEAAISKMQRFGEAPAEILDFWGYRLISPSAVDLDELAEAVQRLWETPLAQELCLREGKLRFPAVRDYRRQSHAGLSRSTSRCYDEAIHLNRRADFGIVEVQVISQGLYRRAFLAADTEEAHIAFVRRRALDLSGDPRAH